MAREDGLSGYQALKVRIADLANENEELRADLEEARSQVTFLEKKRAAEEANYGLLIGEIAHLDDRIGTVINIIAALAKVIDER